MSDTTKLASFVGGAFLALALLSLFACSNVNAPTCVYVEGEQSVTIESPDSIAVCTEQTR